MHLSTESEPDYGRSLFVLLAVGFACACLSYCTAGDGLSVAGADVAPDVMTPALALARLCVNESGMRAYTHDDCAAIHAVLSFRREHVPAYRGLTYVEALHRYSRRAIVERGRRGRPWIVDLWPDAREPARWPARLRWAQHGRWWVNDYRHARRVYGGEVRAECYGLSPDGERVRMAPHTWARSDVRPADPSAQELDCGDRALQTFWSVPAYRQRWPVAAR